MELDVLLGIGTLLTLALVLRAQAGEEARNPQVPQLRPSAPACPYCKEVLCLGPEGEATQRCRGCATRHHEECWSEHGGCAVHGCAGGERARDRRALAPADAHERGLDLPEPVAALKGVGAAIGVGGNPAG